MKTMTLIYIIMINAILSLFAFTGCTKDKEVKKDDVLSIQKTPYTGNQLKIDGYYYTMFGTQVQTIHFLYSNGITADFSGSNENLLAADNYVKDASVIQRIQNTKFSWGVFLIEGNNIKIEQWHPSSGGPLRAYVHSGKILNDATFQITESYRMQNGQKKDISARNETYHFRQYSPKPDSTNSFIP